MSVYSTPMKTCIDEGSSPLSNQSYYYTPKETFSHFTPRSRVRKQNTRYNGNVPKFNIYNGDLSRSEENLKHDDFIVSQSPISVKDYIGLGCRNSQTPAKEAIISFDKENIGVQYTSTPSRRYEKRSNFSPLKDVSNSLPSEKAGTVFEARISSVGKQHFNLRITTEAEVEKTPNESLHKSRHKSYDKELLLGKEKEENRKAKNKSNATFIRNFPLGRKLSRKSSKSVDLGNIEKSKVMVDIPTQTDDEISFNYVCKEPIEDTNICTQRMSDVEKSRNNDLDVDKILVERDDSDVSLLVSRKHIDRKVRIWPFVKIAKFRVSPVKRLFSKSSKYLHSLKQKIISKFSKQPFKKLLDCENEEDPCPPVELNVCNPQQNVCSLCVNNLTNREEMMSKALSALMIKLSNIEDELKEIKGLIKSGVTNTNSNTLRSIQLPPPPPPPPPPNFLNVVPTGPLKRKADLTTPESENHAVKRPAIKNEKTHFAITVEDIKSVKLRKTPAGVLKRETKDRNTQNNEELLRSLKMKNTMKNTSDGKWRTRNLAALCSRENVTFDGKPIDSMQPDAVKVIETPVTSKGGRPQKRKETVIESPVRKRINTGTNSAIYCDEFEDK